MGQECADSGYWLKSSRKGVHQEDSLGGKHVVRAGPKEEWLVTGRKGQ